MTVPRSTLSCLAEDEPSSIGKPREGAVGIIVKHLLRWFRSSASLAASIQGGLEVTIHKS